MTTYTEHPTRTEVREATFCPACKAAPGESCMGTRRPRTSNHLERIKAHLRSERT